MIEANKYLNGHSPDIMNDIFKLRENTYNLWNFHIFQPENPRSLKYWLDAIPYWYPWGSFSNSFQKSH